MRVLMIGAGGVGDAAAKIAAERDFFESWVVADYDLARADRTVASVVSRTPWLLPALLSLCACGICVLTLLR